MDINVKLHQWFTNFFDKSGENGAAMRADIADTATTTPNKQLANVLHKQSLDNFKTVKHIHVLLTTYGLMILLV